MIFHHVLIFLGSTAVAIPQDRNWRDSPIVSSISNQYLDSFAGINWTVSRSDDTLTVPALVPGDLISDLFHADVLNDPIFELTFLDGVWDDVPWIYSSTFSLSPQIAAMQPGDEVLLVVESIQMVADVSLNGHYLGFCNDQFLRYNFSVAPYLKTTNNQLTFTFNVSSDERLIEGRIGGSWGGWDWGPIRRFTSSPPRVGGKNVADDTSMTKGIVRSLYLTRTPSGSVSITSLTPLVHYTGVYPTSVLTDATAGPFLVEVKALVRNPNPASLTDVQLLASWAFGTNTSSIVTLPPGESIVTAFLFAPVGTVSLWWTADVKKGPQSLYNVTASISIGGKQTTAEDSRQIGFKVFTIVTDDDTEPSRLSGRDGSGSGNLTMRFKLNGANIYARGADVIPMEWLRGRESASAYTRMIQSAADAQFNIIRVDGIDIIFPDVFYDACDTLGLLVYHDMQYSQSQPAPVASEMQREELIYSIRRLAPHPSIAIYDGCNECGGRGIYSSFVLTTVTETDPTRPPWPTSPSNGWSSGVDRLTSLPNGNPLVPFDQVAEENLGSRLLLPSDSEKWRTSHSRPSAIHNFPLITLSQSQQSQCSQQQNTDYCNECFNAPAPPATDAGACCDLCAAATSDVCWCAVFYQGTCYFKPRLNVTTPIYSEGRVSVWPAGRGPPPKPQPPGPQPTGPREVHGPYAHGSGFPTVDSDGSPSETIPVALPPQLYPSYDIGLSQPSVFTSEFGAVVMSSFESMSPTLLPEHWSLHGGSPPDECVRVSFFLKCTGGNVMSQRNYAVDTIISAYFNVSGMLDEVGEDSFSRQLYMSMIAQSHIVSSEVQTQRSRNAYGNLLWQLNDIWPSGAWASTEYLTDPSFTPGQTGRWKPLHHLFEKYLYRSVFSACSVDGRCFVKNDHALLSFSNVVVTRSLLRVSDGQYLAVFNNSFSLAVGAGVIEWFCIDGSIYDSSRTCNSTLAQVAIANGCAAGTTGTGSNCVLLIGVANEDGENKESLSAFAQLLDTPAAVVANSEPLFQDELILAAEDSPSYLPDGSLPLFLDFPASAPVGVSALHVVLTAGSDTPGRFSDNSFVLVRLSENNNASSWCSGANTPCAVRIASRPSGDSSNGPTLFYFPWESPPPPAAELAAKIVNGSRVQHLGQYIFAFPTRTLTNTHLEDTIILKESKRMKRGLLNTILALHFSAAVEATTSTDNTVTLHVCCGCGNDALSGLSRSESLNSLLEAQTRLRQQKAAQDVTTTVYIAGTCTRSGLVFTKEDGGVSEESRVTYTSYEDDSPGIISGGVPLLASSLAPVTDASILAQIPPAARQFVMQVDLVSLGIEDTGSPSCHPYMGGEASILPGNLVKAGMELFLYGDATINGDLSPLTLARYPNKDVLPDQWAGGPINGYTISTDASTTPHLPLWAQQIAQDPNSVYVHYLGGLKWDDHVNLLSEVTSTSITLSPCPSHYDQPGFDSLDNKGTFYVYNLLSELDSEGEYYINRTSKMMYVWPPSGPSSTFWQVSPWGKPVVSPVSSLKTIEEKRRLQVNAIDDTIIGELSLNDDLITLDNTGYLTFNGLVFTTAREAAFISNNSTSIHIVNSILQNFGSMAVNASSGSGFLIDSSVVRHAGNGAIFFYAGDRVTLTESGHTVVNSSVSYSNRYLYCYVPMVALADCGNRILDSELFGGPHQGIFLSGNLHNVNGSILHDLVEAASDSGVIYTGRDWTYQGSVISNNVFHRINTADAGDDVSAVYLDDCVSGYTITGNTFINISRALLLGGGRDNLFLNNTVDFVDGSWAVSFDDRGEGWANGMCKGELTSFLDRVPYNSSAVWMSRFPSLVNILQDGPCQARHNQVSNNNYCYGAQPEKSFIDTGIDTIQSWGSVAVNNSHTC